MDSYSWINQPHKFVEDTDKMIIHTEHNTDMWQRTHYGMISDNAPMYLLDVSDKRFTYEVETKFDTNYLFE